MPFVLNYFVHLYMNRINILLEHMIQSAQVQKNDDLEISLRSLKGAIDRGVLSDFANACIKFAEEKVIERMMKEN